MNKQMMDQSLYRSRAFPPVTDELLAGIVRRVRSVGDPVKIVLFGSRARGDHKADSDIDILILEESEKGIEENRNRYEDALRNVYPEMTVLVYSLANVEQWRYVPGYIATVAQAQGRILYEDSEKLTNWMNLSGGAALVREGSDYKTPADLARDWFKRADVDNVACRATIKEACFNLACFHAQQAVEKYLKGFLALHGALLDKTHDLEQLLAHCEQFEAMKDLQALALKEITKYAVKGRYDLAFYPPKAEAESALALALRVREIVLAHVPDAARP